MFGRRVADATLNELSPFSLAGLVECADPTCGEVSIGILHGVVGHDQYDCHGNHFPIAQVLGDELVGFACRSMDAFDGSIVVHVFPFFCLIGDTHRTIGLGGQALVSSSQICDDGDRDESCRYFHMEPPELVSLRHRLRLTQVEAAELIGVRARTWRRWETGERSIPVPIGLLVMLLEWPEVRAWLEERV